MADDDGEAIGQASFPEVQRLAGSLVFIKRLAASPYADLVSPALWSEIEHAFTENYCAIVGFTQESPLFTWCVPLSHTQSAVKSIT